ncbi:DNA replication licensing factor MCM4, partial [Ananas comosus]
PSKLFSSSSAGVSSPDGRSSSPIATTPHRGGNPSRRRRRPVPGGGGGGSPFASASPRRPSRRSASAAPSTPMSTDDTLPPSSSSDAGDDAAFAGDDADPTPVYVWGTSISVQDVNAAILRFLRHFREPDNGASASAAAAAAAMEEGRYMREVHRIMELEGGESLDVDARHVFDYDPDLYGKMVRYPLEVLAIFDIVLMDLVARIDPLFEKHIQTRIFNLKSSVCMRNLNPSDIEKMVSVKGMIIRCSSIIPEVKEAVFRCLICGYYSEPILVDRGRVSEPTRCGRQECLAMNSMTLVHNRCRFVDKQIVKLQETPDEIPEGGTPHTVSILMHDKLVDAGKPGDRVEITGIYRAMSVRIGPTQRTVKSIFKTYIDCLHLKKTDKSRLHIEDTVECNNNSSSTHKAGDDEMPDYQDKVEKLKELSKLPDIYDRLTGSLAPNIWEMDDVKRGLLCQLPSGASFRGDINILLVGDPGTSKSQLLQYIHKLSPRGIYTSGRGSSAVGLTAYVTKDPETGETVLESGALVLSDQGVCCIDEFDKMSDNARSMLHEVMEQQTVSIAKAGIIASLNARTSVLACANPSESRYNPRLSVIDNIHLPPTLLSRFDLIYLILDKPDEQTDRRLAKHVVSLHFQNPEVELRDVREAFRLLEVALQQSATDHSTVIWFSKKGTIDMDLIMTGISASERMRRENLVAATRNLIMEKMQLGGASAYLRDLLEELKKQSSVEVTQNDASSPTS